ncbi:MAG: anti-sigma factor [Nostocoides sp.]
MSIHTLSGAYAVHALDVAEEAAFEAHLATCPDCRAEVVELRTAAASLAATESAAPPAELRNRVLAEIRQVRPLPPLVGPSAGDSIPAIPAPPSPPALARHAAAETDASVLPFRRRLGRRVATGLVAAAVLIGGGVTVATHPWDRGGTTVVALADQVLRAPDAKRTTIRVGSARLSVVRSDVVGRAVVQTQGMAPAPDGKVYEVWLQAPSKQMVKAGFMTGGTDQTVLLDGNARSAIALGVTVEPDGGSDQPTSQPIALVSLPSQA